PEERLLVGGDEISFNQQQVQLTIRPELSRMAAQRFVSFDNIGGLPWFCAFAGASGQLRSQIDSSSLGVFGAGRLGHNSYRGVQNDLVPPCKALSGWLRSLATVAGRCRHPYRRRRSGRPPGDRPAKAICLWQS